MFEIYGYAMNRGLHELGGVHVPVGLVLVLVFGILVIFKCVEGCQIMQPSVYFYLFFKHGICLSFNN